MACHTEGWAERRQPPSADRNWLRHLRALAGYRQEGKKFLARTVVYISECLVSSRIVPGGSLVPQDYGTGWFMSLWSGFCVFGVLRSGLPQQVDKAALSSEWSFPGAPSTLQSHKCTWIKALRTFVYLWLAQHWVFVTFKPHSTW